MIGKVLIEKPFGGVAQLGERYTGSVEVMGSNPTVSTISKALKLDFWAFSFCASFRIVDFTDVLPTNMLRRKIRINIWLIIVYKADIVTE